MSGLDVLDVLDPEVNVRKVIIPYNEVCTREEGTNLIIWFNRFRKHREMSGSVGCPQSD